MRTDEFPDWFRTQIAHLARISSKLAKDRGVSSYGEEGRGISADRLFDEVDAKSALGKAEEVLSLCDRLIKEAFGEEK